MMHTSGEYIIIESIQGEWKKQSTVYYSSKQSNITSTSTTDLIPIDCNHNKQFYTTKTRINIIKEIPIETKQKTSTILQSFIIDHDSVLTAILRQIEVTDEKLIRESCLLGTVICSDGGGIDGKGSIGIAMTIKTR
jgi:hypothetical protein